MIAVDPIIGPEEQGKRTRRPNPAPPASGPIEQMAQALAVEDHDALAVHPANWIAEHCRIITKRGWLEPLEPNVAQIILQSVIDSLRLAGQPVRILVLKARQMGITTYSVALQYCECRQKPYRHALTTAHKEDNSKEIFGKIRVFYGNDTNAPPEQFNSRQELAFAAPHYSNLTVRTAGDKDLGRSTTVHYLHGSEVAFWPTPKQTLHSVLQCVPDDPDTIVVLESTANGAGGEFYNRWYDATPWRADPWMVLPKGRSDYIAVFLPWFIFPDYRREPGPDWTATDEELKLAGRYDLDSGQLCWRRHKIASEFGGDLEKFQQEYPSNDQEAFVKSGRPVFHLAILQAMLDRAVQPGRRGRFDSDGRFTLDPAGRISIWQEPLPGLSYALGGDAAEGKDPQKIADPDYCAAAVVRADSRQLVATIHGRDSYDADQFGADIYWLGRMYHDALVAIEVNHTAGGSVRTTLKRMDYPNLYWRESYRDLTDLPIKELGWLTDTQTRGMLVTDGQAAVRSGHWYIPCASTLRELMGWIFDHTGKATHPPEEHDDQVIAWLIAVQMVARALAGGLPADQVASQAGGTGRDDDFTPDMLAGGIEPGPAISSYHPDDDDDGNRGQ